MLKTKTKSIYYVIYFAILVVTAFFFYFLISNAIIQKREREYYENSWQYVADTNFELKTETNEDGTIETFYAISTPEQLAGFFQMSHSDTVGAESISTYGYKLTNDIDLSGKTWSFSSFSGTFNGNSRHIYNLNINANAQNVGFVSVLYGTIKNVYFDNAQVINTNTAGKAYRTGVVAGFVSGGHIINVTVQKGSVTGNINKGNNDRCAGGIAGYMNNGEIKNCINTANVSTSKFVGGIVGKMNAGTISGCFNKENSLSNGNNIWPRLGGIVAESYGVIENCVNMSSLRLENNVDGDIRIGGIVGHNGGDLSACENLGTIYGGNYYNNTTYVGGIAGYSTKNIFNCYNSGGVYSKAKTWTSSSDSNVSISSDTKRHNHTFYYEDDELWSHGVSYMLEYKRNVSKIEITDIQSFAGGIVGYGDCSVSNSYNEGVISGGYKKIYAQISESMVSEISGYSWGSKSSSITYYFTVYTNCRVGAINGNQQKDSENKNVISKSSKCLYQGSNSFKLSYYTSKNYTTKEIKGNNRVSSNPIVIDNESGIDRDDSNIHGEINQEIISKTNSYQITTNPKYSDSGKGESGFYEGCNLTSFYNKAQIIFQVNDVDTTFEKDSKVTFVSTFTTSNLSTLGTSNWEMVNGKPRLKNLYW